MEDKNKLSSSQSFLNVAFNYFFLITIPLYFVLDASNQFWGWVPLNSSAQVFTFVFISMIIGLLGFRFILQEGKARVFLIWVLICYLFFKTIKDWLVITAGLHLLSSYAFYIGFLLLLTIVFFFIVKRLSFQTVQRLNSYLNLVFLVLVFVEIGKSTHNYINRHTVTFNTDEVKFAALTNGKFPDVYILQFDEYAGLHILRNGYGFNNGRFIDELEKRSFQVVQHSNSNYNGTPFSVLSLLNMGYIEGITKTEVASAIAYSKSVEAIKTNYLMQFFNSNNYNVFNHSFFEVEQTRSLDYLFLPVKKRLMLDKTFGSVLVNDLLCSVNSNSFHFFINDLPARIDNYNQEVIKRSYETIISEKKPLLMFSHFMMPHSPYLRDSSGKLKNIGAAYRESNKGLNIDSYLNYLKYCNTVSLGMIDSIQKLKPNSVIVLLSDHGLRNARKGDRKYSEFNNLMAIYSPQNATPIVPDSLCTVNVFRLIMNKHFGQSFPMLENRMVNVNMGLVE